MQPAWVRFCSALFFLMISFIVTLIPIVLYTGAINLESIFNVSEVLEVSKKEGLWITIVGIGLLGSLYAIFGGLCKKAPRGD